jgi:hypothetical protein
MSQPKSNVTPISRDVQLYVELRNRLISEHPDLDETTLADTLEGETDLQERIVRICRAAREAECQADVVSLMASDLAARKKRHEDRAQRLRDIALWAMEESGIPKIAAPDMTIGIAKGRVSVKVTDPYAIPPHLCAFDPRPDKAAIKTALEAGEDVPGAVLSNSGPSLSLRTK